MFPPTGHPVRRVFFCTVEFVAIRLVLLARQFGIPVGLESNYLIHKYTIRKRVFRVSKSARFYWDRLDSQ
jgi:hypothetical protein